MMFKHPKIDFKNGEDRGAEKKEIQKIGPYQYAVVYKKNHSRQYEFEGKFEFDFLVKAEDPFKRAAESQTHVATSEDAPLEDDEDPYVDTDEAISLQDLISFEVGQIEDDGRLVLPGEVVFEEATDGTIYFTLPRFNVRLAIYSRGGSRVPLILEAAVVDEWRVEVEEEKEKRKNMQLAYEEVMSLPEERQIEGFVRHGLIGHAYDRARELRRMSDYHAAIQRHELEAAHRNKI